MLERQEKRQTANPQERVQQPRSEWLLTTRSPIALTDMTRGLIPLRDDLDVGHDIYDKLANEPVSLFTATQKGSDNKEYIMVGPSLTAEEINALFYFNAPDKTLRFDTVDILEDWVNLYTRPEHEAKKKAHATMHGWSQFEESRDLLWGVLKRNYRNPDFTNKDPDDVVIPVLRWKQETDGEQRIILEPMDEGLRSALAEKLPQQITDTKRLDIGMGMMYLAAYSPEQTQWPKWDGYRAYASGGTQTIGPTQVLAYAYREIANKQKDPLQVRDNHDIQKSPFLPALVSYAETRALPTIEIDDTSGESF